MRLTPLCAFSLLIASATLPSVATEYSFQTLEYPGADYTSPQDINNDGIVVGVFAIDDNDFPIVSGFIWQDGEFSAPDDALLDLGLLDAAFSAISDSGLIVGAGIDLFSFSTPIFIIEPEPGEFETFNVFEEVFAFPSGINESREVVGAFLDEDGNFRSFLRQDDQVVEITIPGLSEVGATDLNEAGQIVGGALNEAGEQTGFVLHDGEVTLVKHPDGETELLAINNLGTIAGSVFEGDSSRSFIFDGSTFTDFTFPGSDETVIWGMNDHGVVVGEYFVSDAEEGIGFIATPVPEPGGATIALLGLSGMLSWRRRNLDREPRTHTRNRLVL